MTLLDSYKRAVQKGEIDEDSLQEKILEPMQRLVDEWNKPSPSCPWFFWKKKKLIKGIYLYGPVGVGKTYLVDMLYKHIAGENKARFHFHHFMQQIDAKLRRFQGQKNPLRFIAKDLARSIRLLCFDEFLVHDVAYAMILSELLQALADEEVILVISSNTAPNDLYLNGIHRKRFLPAIDLIKKNCEVLHLQEDRDYRLGRTPLMETYLSPLSQQNQELMEKQFMHQTQKITENGLIQVQNRDIPYLKMGTNRIWFDFSVLCNLPRSQLDYLELANRFDTIFLSNTPVLTEKHTAQAILFIHFIDVLYDRGIKLILSAAVPAQELYLKGEMTPIFARTLSRLQEMQSIDYLSRHPKRELKDL